MKKYARATDQDPLVEIFPNIYLLRGSIKIGPMLQMNRNMVVVRDGNELTIINAVRLNEENEKQLNKLGKVTNVIRLGDFHGLDDQFYIDTYKPEFWSQKKHTTYPDLIPTKIINQNTISPIKKSKFFIFDSAKFPESALLLEENRLLITTDSIQYWNDWKYVSFLSKIFLFLMGFRLGLFVGGPWLKKVSIQKNSMRSDFQKLLDLDFTNIVAAHGNILRDDAKSILEKMIAKTFE